MKRIIIQAGGDGTRWDNYLCVKKHFIEIEGEILIERIVRQVKKYTNDIYIVGSDEKYKIEGCNLLIPHQDPKWKDCSIFKSSELLWSNKSGTVLMAGDAYYTDKAIDLAFNHELDWRWVARLSPSSCTGCEYKETFALSFKKDMNKIISKYIDEIIEKKIMRLSNYHLMAKLANKVINDVAGCTDIEELKNHPNIAHIDDWTEDFDYPHDLERWKEGRKKLL